MTDSSPSPLLVGLRMATMEGYEKHSAQRDLHSEVRWGNMGNPFIDLLAKETVTLKL